MGLKHHSPMMVSWEVTRACNLSCKHCGSAAGFQRDAELDAEGALEVCRQLDAFPKAHVALTGGEVLVRKDWEAIAGELMRRRGSIGLQTNAWAVDEEMVRRLVELRGRSGRIGIGLSLDGDRATHDRIRREGSYDRVVAALRMLREQGFGCAVITTVNRLNRGCLEHVRDVVVGAGCYGWQVQVTTSFGRAAEDNDLVVDRRLYREIAEDVARLRRGLVASRAKTRLMTADSIGYMGRLEGALRPRPWSGCQAGLRVAAIQSNGDVKGCLFLIDESFVEGNVMRTPIAEIWERAGAFSYNRDFDPSRLAGPCASCAHGPRCRAGCRALAFSTHGHVDEAGCCLHALEQGWIGEG